MARRGQNQFEHGYFCAVATLLRMEGCVSAQIRELFVAGGDASKANRHDIETFREHGLLPTPPSASPTGEMSQEGGEHA